MTERASHGAASRVPVYEGKQRVRGLWQRRRADGKHIYESQFRQAGRVRRVVHPDGLTKTEAIAAHRRLVLGVESGEITIGDRSLSVRGLVASFLARERGVLASRSKSTVDLYASVLKKHVLPVIGPMKADELAVQHVRKLIDRLVTQGASGATVRNCMSALSAVYRHGVRDLGAVSRNPVRDLDRGDRPSGKRRSEPRYLSVLEVEALLAKLGDEYRPVAAALFYAALRISEALALTWADVDFAGASLWVPGTKTKGAAANIPLLPPLAEHLRAHRERQAKRGFAYIRPGALVFQSANGTPQLRSNALRAVKAAADAAGLNGKGREPVGCHDLRHSCAAFAFSLGMTPVEVARLLRHSDPAVTLTTYAGLDDATVAGLGAKLAAGLGT